MSDLRLYISMARYVIDAPTLLHLADAGLRVDPGHQLVAPSRSPPSITCSLPQVRGQPGPIQP